MPFFKVFFGVSAFNSLFGNDTPGARNLFTLAQKGSIDIVTCSLVINTVLEIQDQIFGRHFTSSAKIPFQEPSNVFTVIDPDHVRIKMFMDMGMSGPEAVKAASIAESNTPFFATTNEKFLKGYHNLLRTKIDALALLPEVVYTVIQRELFKRRSKRKSPKPPKAYNP